MIPLGITYLGSEETRGSPPLVKEDDVALAALSCPLHLVVMLCHEVQHLKPASILTSLCSSMG